METNFLLQKSQVTQEIAGESGMVQGNSINLPSKWLSAIKCVAVFMTRMWRVLFSQILELETRKSTARTMICTWILKDLF